MPCTAYSGISITAMAVVPGSSYDEYSFIQPDAMPGIAYSGGWATQADVGPDIIYQTAPGSLLAPAPITWTNAAFADTFHNNDPAFTAPSSDAGADRAGWTFMYFTSLPNADATAALMTVSNEISLATSTDGGKTWMDLGPILGNGWSPSVVNTGSQIDLFYHTNAPTQAMMVPLSEDGWQQLAAPRALMDTATHAPLEAVNVSVAQFGDTLVLVGNGFGGGAQFGDIVAFKAIASDPYDWTPLLSSGPVLVHGGAVELLTPEVKITGQNTLTVWFTEDLAHNSAGGVNGQPQATATMEWSMTLI